MKRWMDKILCFGSLGVGFLTLFYVYVMGYYKVVNMPAMYKLPGYVVIPVMLLFAIVTFDKWMGEMDNPDLLAGAWLFLIGLFGPVLLTWCRPWSKVLYEYRLLPLVLPMGFLVYELIKRIWLAYRPEYLRRRIRHH